MLVIVCGCDKFDQYVDSNKMTVEINHKLPVSISQESILNASMHITIITVSRAIQHLETPSSKVATKQFSANLLSPLPFTIKFFSVHEKCILAA